MNAHGSIKTKQVLIIGMNTHFIFKNMATSVPCIPSISGELKEIPRLLCTLCQMGYLTPDIPTQVSWSGYFEYSLGRDSLTFSYTNYTGEAYEICTKYFAYFYPALFNNFAARMDWAKEGKGNRNPVVNINNDKGINPIEIVCKQEKKLSWMHLNHSTLMATNCDINGG